MGGRGGAGGSDAGVKLATSQIKEQMKYTSGATAADKIARLTRSGYFIDGVKNAVSKDYFMRGKEVTTSQLNKIVDTALKKAAK
jgi:hypothetical protein